MTGPGADRPQRDGLYAQVYMGLVILTALTLGAFVVGSSYHLGRILAVSVALAIAFTKAALIAIYFMHLSGERPLIYGIVAVGIAAVSLLALGLLPDIGLRL